MPTASKQKVRFGPFELDRQSGELFKLGQKLILHGQPIEVLSILLERPGELITREELCHCLWPQDTFVDYEHSLNTAIKKLRQALDDDPDNPRYIETLPKKGYRFIAQVEAVGNGIAPVADLAPKPRPWKLATAITLFLVAAAAAPYWLVRPRIPVVTAIHQLTRTGQARPTPYGIHRVVTDGTRLYFVERNDISSRFAQISIKGGEVSYIDIPSIRKPELVDSSADGSQLLVLDLRGDRVDDTLWLVTLPNGPQRRIGDLKAVSAGLFPDSQHVAYTQSPDFTKLLTADLEGGQVRPIFSATTNIGAFSISPDGRKIRFNAADGIWEALLDGSKPHRILTQHLAHICCGAWSRDGGIYAFASEDDDGTNLWAITESRLPVHRQVSQPVRLTNVPISFRYPRFSQDGNHIYAFGQTRLGELSIFDSGSGQLRPYLNGISAGFVDFSRDGQWVTYVTDPQNALWRSRIDGSERLQLTFPPMNGVINPKWSPDGRFIAFTEWGSPNKIYLIPAEGGAPMLLLAGDSKAGDPTWSPDGKFIAYGGASIFSDAAPTIRILSLETKQSTTISGSKNMYSPRWSPDGRYLAALSYDAKKLLLYSFDADRWKELLLPETGPLGWPTWSHDSRYLYVTWAGKTYRFHVPDGGAELALDTSAIDRTCPLFSVCAGWFGLTPDDRILVLRDRGTDELYALDLEYR
jgi:Tol biopolymer transport system component/DNA-binding winged helix-turn-helix (wHTH) protein